MSKTKGLPQVVTEIYGLLEPFESDDRQKIVSSVMTLLGEVVKTAKSSTKNGDEGGDEGGGGEFGSKAKRWMRQNSISDEMIDEIFHCENGDVEVIAGVIAGRGKRAQTINCYLLAGIRSLLASDEAKFSEDDAVDLCKSLGCHDSPNHSKTRGELGNSVAGSKSNGYTLSAPGLRAAATLIKEMAT